jgi:hypothetical protein
LTPPRPGPTVEKSIYELARDREELVVVRTGLRLDTDYQGAGDDAA